jgi:hypothetical protein
MPQRNQQRFQNGGSCDAGSNGVASIKLRLVAPTAAGAFI